MAAQAGNSEGGWSRSRHLHLLPGSGGAGPGQARREGTGVGWPGWVEKGGVQIVTKRFGCVWLLLPL